MPRAPGNKAGIFFAVVHPGRLCFRVAGRQNPTRTSASTLRDAAGMKSV